jgi:hypothetical protein
MKYALAITLSSFLFLTTTYAADQVPATQSHEEHHPDAQPTTPSADSGSGMMKGGMMDGMNQESMKGMMHECMETHKDGKMCHHEMMEKCEAKMSKSECKKMMKHAKSGKKNGANN